LQAAWPERSVGNPFLDRLPGWLDGLLLGICFLRGALEGAVEGSERGERGGHVVAGLGTPLIARVVRARDNQNHLMLITVNEFPANV